VSETPGSKIRALVEKVFKEKHDYLPTTLEDHPTLDRAFYEELTKTFQTHGFTWVGDVVDLTMSQANPSYRTCLRVFVGEGGRIMGALYHIRFRGWGRVLQWVGLIPRQIKVIDFETEFLNGVFVGTTNAPTGQGLSHGPRVRREYHRGARFERLLEFHRQRVKEHVLKTNTAVALTGSLDAVLESQQRLNMLEALHRKSVGGVTKEELTALGGPLVTEEIINEVYQQVRDAAK